MRRDDSETGCPVGSFFPKGALTHHLRDAQHLGGGGIPPGGRAVRSPRGNGACAFCGKRRTMRAMLLSSAAGGISVIARPAHRLVVAICFPNGNAARLFAKSAAGRFGKGAGRGFASGQLLREKVRIATAPLESRNDEYERGMKATKGSDNVWQSTIWKRRSSAAGRDDLLVRRRPI